MMIMMERRAVKPTTATVVVEPAQTVPLSTDDPDSWRTKTYPLVSTSNLEVIVYSSDDPSETTGQDGCDSYHTREQRPQGTPGTWSDVTRLLALTHVASTRPDRQVSRIERLTGDEAEELLAGLRGGAVAFRVALLPR